MDKQKLHQDCLSLLDSKVVGLTNAVHEAQEAVNSDGKSSAGDKHETGREMARQEVEKLGAQLMVAEKTYALASKIRSTVTEEIGMGALIQTNHGLFYLLVSLGKVTCNEKDVFVISLNSPMGQQFIGKKIDDQFTFMNKTYVIEKVN